MLGKAPFFPSYQMIREVGIKRAIISEVEVTSFLDPAPPFPDESLLGYYARVADDHLFGSMNLALKKAGINTLYPEGLATHLDAEKALAFSLKTSECEIARRMHRSETLGMMEFFGTLIRKVYHEQYNRRVSPRALKIAPYYRAIWRAPVASGNIAR